MSALRSERGRNYWLLSAFWSLRLSVDPPLLPCASILGAGSSGWGSSMDLRKALIAAPRSPPMVRTFLVPKTIMTTSNTITQCQILMLPIGGLLRGNLLPARRGGGAAVHIPDGQYIRGRTAAQ